MHVLKKIIVIPTSLLLLLFVIMSISGCDGTTPIDADNILSQLPDDGRLILVPEEIYKSNTKDFNIISFNDIVLIQEKEGVSYDEEGFYKKAHTLGIQYILISADMTSKINSDFPWMTNKNFRVCPGNVDHKSQRYYTLLVWDNSKNTYHFFKFLYEVNK